ncbi:methyltransferase domain-containing protein [Cyanobacterium aponinum FACHB-4101]|uniref:methyltransferase domain-containing protein n=1 Tax=Cyanobacterium aponinum TaxID=379064 RepID=UPI0016800BAD|nr:methyltransferase domain-containing protein [Cyanobacterium aponinum]MBD2395448.1 methyltransferase domain-containing protein [Cyanobacterium aponinum FACHB-4101]
MNYNVENSVLERYELGAKEHQPSLCCPTEYDQSYLAIIPEEIIEKDYGCGDPTRYVNLGETVLDLGSGAGKNCYILAQKVGKNGQVLGVDFNDEMLNLAQKYQSEIANKIGYNNTAFLKGKIQDLQLPLSKVESYLNLHPIQSLSHLRNFETECDRLRQEETLIKDNSIDVVISNCVLNLVKTADKKQLFAEIYRVLKKGGRAIISDIVCDEDLPSEITNDSELWSGCIAGAFREDLFLEMFAEAGFYGIEILTRQDTPWQVIDGIEFRSLTVRAYKGKEGECLERNQAIIYKGPWKKVEDDDGNTFYRGERMAVCDKTFQIMTKENSPYSSSIIGINPLEEIPLEKAKNFNEHNHIKRDPKITKGNFYQENKTTNKKQSCC